MFFAYCLFKLKIKNNKLKRLIPDLLSVTKKMKLKEYLVTIDTEKAFDSLDHTFHTFLFFSRKTWIWKIF